MKMTDDEAIKFLQSRRDLIRTDYPEIEDYAEALDVAISALEQEPQTNGDCISRQDVIDLAEWFDLNLQHFNVANLIDEVENMPSVTPKEPKTGHWIPVSKRLPEDGRPVLVYAWSVHHVIARYDEFRTENGYKKTWVTADAWNGNTEINHEVIAWMPLPEPYKEREVSE